MASASTENDSLSNGILQKFQQYNKMIDKIPFIHTSPQISETNENQKIESSYQEESQMSNSGCQIPIYLPISSLSLDQRPSLEEFSCSDSSRSPSPIKVNQWGGESPSNKKKNSRGSLKISIPLKMQQSKFQPIKKMYADKYISLEKIGQGSMGEVRKCREIHTQKIYAVKIISFQDGENLLNITREFFLLQNMKHPNIVRVYDFFIETKKCYIIQDYVVGFSLTDFLKRNSRMNEEQAKFVVIEITKAIEYLNNKGISHRDITSNNILIDETKNSIKLIDFSNSKSFDFARRMMTKTGTLSYMAPEIFSEQEYDKLVDIWSLGVMLFQLLTGQLPFSDENELILIQQIQAKEIKFSHQNSLFHHLSQEAIDFMQGLLQRKASNRMTASQALSHPWLKSVNLMYEFKKINRRDRSPVHSERVNRKRNQISQFTIHCERINDEVELDCSLSKRMTQSEQKNSRFAESNNSNIERPTNKKQPSIASLLEADSEEASSNGQSQIDSNPIVNLLPQIQFSRNCKFSYNDTNFNSKNTDSCITEVRKRSRSSIFYANELS